MKAILICLLLSLPAWAALDVPELVSAEEALELLALDKNSYQSERVVIFDRTKVDVESTGLSHRYQHRMVKVLKDSGAKALRALRFDFDPASNHVEILGLRVHRADSSFVDIDTSQASDITAPAGGIYWGARMLVQGLPALKVGDAVEFISYTKGFLIAYLGGEGANGTDSDEERFIPPMRGHFYDVVTFQETLPALEIDYIVRLSREQPLQYTVYNGEVYSSLEFDEDAFLYHFWKRDVPALATEARMPDLTDIAPKVVMATVADWEEKSRWFFETNEWVFESNPEIDAMVREITEPLRKKEDKIAALLHWVAQNIRYSGLSMGKGEGYTIHPSEMTFRDRCGVCKDIAGMLVTMLRSAGFETYPAMTMAGSRVEAVPADQFNHCVVALKEKDGGFLMLDPTWAPWNRPLWSRWEGEQHYVIGTEEGETLMSIPSFEAEDNLMYVENHAQFSEDGSIEGRFTVTGSGISDGRLRSAVADRPRAELRGYLEDWLGRISSSAELLSYEFSDHRDFSQDTRLDIEYRLPSYASLSEDAWLFASPSLELASKFWVMTRMASVPESEERTHDLFMWAPQKLQIEEEIRLPRGLEVEAPPDTSLQSAAANANIDWNVDKRKLELQAELSLTQRMVSSEDYPALRDLAKAWKEKTSKEIYARKGGAK